MIDVTQVEDLLARANVHDATILDLIWREQSIRAELARRESIVMHGLRWAILSTRPASRPAGHASLTDARARNSGGRRGPGGPGRWND